MKTVTKYKVEYRQDENGDYTWMEVPHEKFILEEDKKKIVTDYYLSHEPVQNVVERYNLSSKQVLFNWMDKYLHEESLIFLYKSLLNPSLQAIQSGHRVRWAYIFPSTELMLCGLMRTIKQFPLRVKDLKRAS